jgi:hypothetical protein
MVKAVLKLQQSGQKVLEHIICNTFPAHQSSCLNVETKWQNNSLLGLTV